MPVKPVALSIAGFDTSAGAGLQADLLTFHNRGYHCVTAATSLVVESPLEVSKVQTVPAELLRQQVSLLLETYPVAAIKIGLLSSPEQVFLLSEILAKQTAPIVLDPVGISSTGTTLQEEGTAIALVNDLAPLVTLITPNLPEVETLLGGQTEKKPEDAARQLADKTGTSILLTGGHHGEGLEITDTLVSKDTLSRYCAPAIPNATSLHGTGCVLSSAISAGLGQGESLSNAIERARRYLREAMQNHLIFPHSKPLLALNHHSKGGHDQ